MSPEENVSNSHSEHSSHTVFPLIVETQEDLQGATLIQ